MDLWKMLNKRAEMHFSKTDWDKVWKVVGELKEARQLREIEDARADES